MQSPSCSTLYPKEAVVMRPPLHRRDFQNFRVLLYLVLCVQCLREAGQGKSVQINGARKSGIGPGV